MLEFDALELTGLLSSLINKIGTREWAKEAMSVLSSLAFSAETLLEPYSPCGVPLIPNTKVAAACACGQKEAASGSLPADRRK